MFFHPLEARLTFPLVRPFLCPVYTTDLRIAGKMSEELETGMVGINVGILSASGESLLAAPDYNCAELAFAKKITLNHILFLPLPP